MTAFSPNYLDSLLLVISALDGITPTTEDLLNFCKLALFNSIFSCKYEATDNNNIYKTRFSYP